MEVKIVFVTRKIFQEICMFGQAGLSWTQQVNFLKYKRFQGCSVRFLRCTDTKKVSSAVDAPN